MEAREQVVLDRDAVQRALKRIAHEIVERNRGVRDVALVGIRTGGEGIAKRLSDYIHEIEGARVPCGYMDITMYRDDIFHAKTHPVVHKTEIPFEVEDKVVVLVDDVIFTGRTTRAALDGLMDLGRPRLIQLAALIDRGHRELPIRPDFVGRNLPTARGDLVTVYVGEDQSQDRVVITEGKEGPKNKGTCL
jgi:pyrimidine operon attenuation protein/uracil phosphoribosyltransferase